MENLTHWKKLTNRNYIGSYSLQPGEERVVEIVKVAKEPVKGEDGKEESCIVAHLKNEKPFILNSTNCKTITKIAGSAFIEHWAGIKITIYVAKIRAFGEEMEALRVKNEKPSLPVLNKDSNKWQGAIKALKDGKTTMDWISKNYTISEETKTELLSIVNQPA